MELTVSSPSMISLKVKLYFVNSVLPPFDYDYSILPAQLHQTMFHFEAFGPLANHDMPVFCVFIIQAMKYYLVKF